MHEVTENVLIFYRRSLFDIKDCCKKNLLKEKSNLKRVWQMWSKINRINKINHIMFMVTCIFLVILINCRFHIVLSCLLLFINLNHDVKNL